MFLIGDEMEQSDEWREILTESIVYGMLFKAVAKDADSMDPLELKLSYRPLMDAVSRWAERKHHEFRRQFGRLGGKVHSQGLSDGFLYIVLVTVRGLQHQNIYNSEILKAECQDRLNRFIEEMKI